MKKLLVALLLVTCSLFASAEDAKFLIGTTKFVYTVREGAITYDLVVLYDDPNNIYQGWGGADGSVIVEDFNDDTVLAKGGRRAFIVWGLAEAKRRAIAHMNSLKPPAPDINSRMASTVYNIRYSLTSLPDLSDIIIPPAPLP